MTMLPANYIDVVQQSPDWIQMRLGMLTGSVVADAVAKMVRQPALSVKCKEGKHGICTAKTCTCECHPEAASGVLYQQCRENLMRDIAYTRISGSMPENYVSRAMEDGIEREPLAIAAYENIRDVMVEPIGFVFHPEIKWYGCSPDGLLGSDIVLEVKCPTPRTHMRYLEEAADARARGLDYVPEEYLPQIKAHLSCTERPMVHFVSYHPGFKSIGKELLVTEWRRDKGMIDDQNMEVVKFLAETELMMERFKNL